MHYCFIVVSFIDLTYMACLIIISFPKYEILASDKDGPAQNAQKIIVIRLYTAQYFKKATFTYLKNMCSLHFSISELQYSNISLIMFLYLGKSKKYVRGKYCILSRIFSFSQNIHIKFQILLNKLYVEKIKPIIIWYFRPT